MSIKIKKTLIIVLVVFLSGTISYIVTATKLHNHTVIARVNSELSDLATEMNLIEYWNKNLKNDRYLEKEIKSMILTKILILFTVKPDLKELGIAQLEALSRAATFHNEHRLSYGEHDEVYQNSLLYLKAIETAVNRELKERRILPKVPITE